MSLALALSESTLNAEQLNQQILPHVEKPGRYLGLEYGAYNKPWHQATVRMAMLFPDLYEIGISNYGHRMLYSLVNNDPRFLCDRAYAPAKDMFDRLKSAKLPLYGIESLQPLKNFDLLAFTLQYELNYTSLLGILDAAGLPFRTVNRDDHCPILIAGGPGSANPMPLAPFIDAFIVGDGEHVLIEVLEVLDAGKKQGWTNAQTRKALADLEGVYVHGLSKNVQKRIVDITQQQIDIAPLTPHIQSVHDRIVVEARRGCDRMCRFCQPCFINLPVREQTIDNIKKQALEEADKTGYEECSLLSLSIADYSQLKPLINEVSDALKEKKVSLSLPSQRADRFDIEVAQAVQQVRKSTLTFAPEAGTERLRAVINKNLTEAEIMKAVVDSYTAGWNKVKLYFMIGLPTETDKDLDGIVSLVKKMKLLCEQVSRERSLSFKKHLEVNVTLSNFVPKPHTPFQWWPQDTLHQLHHKILYLKEAFKTVKGIKLSFTDPELSKLECVISKGDERIADVIELAYHKGAYLDAWEEHMTFPQWYESLDELGLDAEQLTNKAYTQLKEVLPWDHIDVGVDKDWLQEEYRKSVQAEQSDPCFVGCNTCGVCTTLNVQPVFITASSIANRDYEKSDESKGDFKIRQFPKATHRVRLKIQKTGQMRFISHLDWLRLLQKAVIRAHIPVAYTQGFNPTPRVCFGPALPLFVAGASEYIELELTSGNMSPQKIMAVLNEQLPDNGKVTAAEAVPVHGPSIDKQLASLTYAARYIPTDMLQDADSIKRTTCDEASLRYTLFEKFKSLSQQPQWLVEVQNKKTGFQTSFDIKSLVKDFRLTSDDTVQFTVLVDRGHNSDSQAQSQTPPTAKPSWILKLLDPDAQWETTREAVTLRETALTK